MFCSKCGTALTPDMAFCPVCGTRTEESPAPVHSNLRSTMPSSTNPSFTTPGVPGVTYTAPEPTPTIPSTAPDFPDSFGFPSAPKPPKRSKLKLGLMITAIVVLLSGVALAAEYFGNFIGLFATPEEEFRSVLNNNFEDFAETAASNISALKSQTTLMDSTTTGNVKITLGDEIKDILADEIGPGSQGAISWIDTIGANTEFTLTKDAIAANLALNANNTSVLSSNVVFDIAGGNGYVSVPELNSTALRFDFSDASYELKNSLNAFEQMDSVTSFIPEENDLKDFIIKYTTIVTDGIKNVTETDDTISTNGVSQDCTRYAAIITNQDAAVILKAILTELKNDPTVKESITAMETQYDMTGAYDEFVAEINDLLDELESSDNSLSNVTLNVKMWADDDSILGMSLSDSENTFDFTYVSALDDDNYGSTIKLSADNQEFAINTAGIIDGDEFNGESTISFAGTNLATIGFKNVDVDKYNDGVFEGSISFEFSSEFISMMRATGASELDILSGIKITLDIFESNDTSAKTSISIHRNDALLISLDISGTIDDSKEITIPTNYVDTQNSDEMLGWATNMNIDGLFDSLEEAGLPSLYVNLLEKALDEALR